MYFLNYKSIKTLTSREKSIKFQVFDEIIDNVLDNKIDKLKLKICNKEFV